MDTANMNNRFVFLIGSYNNEMWCSQNIESVLSQTYTNFRILYYNAASTDKTFEIAKQYADKDSRIKLVTTKERHPKTWFLSNLSTFEVIEDSDIVCILDGDDFLASEEVLSYVNEVYNKSNCWMTYGGMKVWSGGESVEEPYPQNTEAPYEIKQNKNYRIDLWRYSHFRTYKGFLWNRINKQDWVSSKDGEYMSMEDLITMYSCMEMCPSDKVFRIDQPVYIWNSSNANGGSRTSDEFKINNTGNIQESELRLRPKYKELEIVSPVLAGGLGNQMFEIAAAASLCKDNNAILLIDASTHILPNQGKNINVYLENIFSKIATDNNPPVTTNFEWPHSSYKESPYKPNLKLGGHNQSWKYLDHNRKYIQELFSIPSSLKETLFNKYDFSNTTAIQVRRGDYYKFPDSHPQLEPDYFYKAVKMANPNEIFIFSDSIEWCKENLKFECPVRYINEEDYVELYMMSFCKNVIISNSSFGWWGAYLNTRPDKTIYVPSTWFGEKILKDGFNIDDLLLPDWIKI